MELKLFFAIFRVISRKDTENLYERHVLHSLAVAKLISFVPGTEILDVGTGGGFPGIPLAIMFPESKFHLVDSVGKKIKVVKEISSSLKLNNVFAEQARAESVNKKFDFIVSRAVTELPEFVVWVKNKIKTKNINAIPNGILYIKGGNVIDEIVRLHGWKNKVTEISSFFPEEFFETKKIVHLYYINRH
jgi:16S rRNA (guanine527-N7)-methyltransferase